MSWSREQCQLLIEEVQKYTCLYAVKSPHYKNTHARQTALEHIQESLQLIKPNVSIGNIKAKFNGLKSNFQVEYRKWNSSRCSGAGDDENNSIYTPTIWYFKMMFFLLDHVQVRSAIDSMAEEVETSQDVADRDSVLQEFSDDGRFEVEFSTQKETEDVPSTSSCTPSARPKKRRRNIEDCGDLNLMKETSKTLATITETITKLNQPDNEIENEDDTLAKFIVTKLKKIKNENVRLETEEEIVTILYAVIKKSNKL
ncbi:hypothetical protein FQR65_LT18397 [Abscondita terminalis]|nr:hypothetical protein FQR65_LT18397 [Abscondita terminalis]